MAWIKIINEQHTTGLVKQIYDTITSRPTATRAVPQITEIISVFSNEPADGLGAGDTAPDVEITGDLSLNLRAERSGKGTGRVYTITVECSDASGNTSTRSVDVTVPHTQGKGNGAKP